MNSLASILYSSSSAKTKKRKNLSLQPSIKPLTNLHTKSFKFKTNGMLFRSSTPKTPLTRTTHPNSTSSCISTNSPQTPRCSTPLFSKQRRTRPFIVCELCRQRAFDTLNENENKNDQKHIAHHPSTTLCQYQIQTNIKIHRRPSSIDQLLVWIV